MASSFIKTLS